MATHDYRITDYSYIHSHNQEDFSIFIEAISPRQSDLILEAFCGYGETTQKLLDYEKNHGINCTHYLIDASETQVNRAKEALGSEVDPKNIETADAMEIPFSDESFDIVVVKMGLHEVSQASQNHVLNELFRVLKKGGRFVTWEIALPEDQDSQRIFREVIYRKNELAGFYDINRNRFFQTENSLIQSIQDAGFSEVKKVHDIWYKFESLRRKEEMVSTERKFLTEQKGIIDAQEEYFLKRLSEYKLEELNKSIKEIISDSNKEEIQFKQIGEDNLAFLAHKAIITAIK